ncbi:MAG: hypothetical protein ACREX7_07110 [Casimicrobiaceae bacterium]
MYTAETEPRSKKTLIIGFAGHFHRLMLPMPVLLDCFDPAVYDVLVLRDFNRAFFARGIDGLGGDFVGAISNLRERFDPGSYRNAIALGTSSGGLPAVLGAVMLGLRRGVAVGGIDFPALTARLRNQGISEAVYARLLACRPQPFPDLILAYGADYAIDVASNRGLHGRVPSRLHAIEGCAIHGVLAWLVARGSLPAFLETVLDQSLETGNPTSPPRGAMDTVQLTKGDT